MSIKTSQVTSTSIGFCKTGSLSIKEQKKSSGFLRTFFSLPSYLSLLKTASTAAIFSLAIHETPSVVQFEYIECEKYFHKAALPVKEENRIVSTQVLREELKSYLWSEKGLNQKSIIQRSDNCQIIANLIASTFTKEGVQNLESLIEVTDYNLDEKNFYINFRVNINGKSIPVSYSDLIDRIGRRDHLDPLAPHAIALAVEEELAKNYLPNPSGYTALSTATFITNKDYSALPLDTLSDESLINILKQAPSKIVTVGSKLPPLENKTLTFEHAYAVKNYKHENGQHFITLVAYGEEVTLTLDELRENMRTITAETKNFNVFDEKTLEIYLLSLIATLVLSKVINLANKKEEQSNKSIKNLEYV